MDDNNTLRSQERLRVRESQYDDITRQATIFQETESAGRKCSVCGAINEPGALFCEHCGVRLRDKTCPQCGAPMEEESDYCEHCHQYVDTEHCSFCHALVGPGDVFCPECGASLSGIECPVCHTVGRFGFCEACGTPLTDSARKLLEQSWEQAEVAGKVRQLEEELERLWLTMPVTSDQQVEKRKAVHQLELRVKQLIAAELAKQEGNAPAPKMAPAEVSEDVTPLNEQGLQAKIEETRQELQKILDSMATAPHTNPAYARNIAMARKPRVSRLAWRCNYKQALHPSPMGCACPQHGGTWVVMDGRSVMQLD